MENIHFFYVVGWIVGIVLLFIPRTEWAGLFITLMMYLFIATAMGGAMLSNSTIIETNLFNFIMVLSTYVGLGLSFVTSVFVMLISIHLWTHFYQYGNTVQLTYTMKKRWTWAKSWWVASMGIGGIGIFAALNRDFLFKQINNIISIQSFKSIVNAIAVGSLVPILVALVYMIRLYRARGSIRPTTPKHEQSEGRGRIRPILPYDELWGFNTLAYLANYSFA